MRISASKTKRYLQCPRSYEDSYIRGNWGDPSQPATQGSIAHEAIARGYEYKKKHGKLPSPESFATALQFGSDEEGDTAHRELEVIARGLGLEGPIGDSEEMQEQINEMISEQQYEIQGSAAYHFGGNPAGIPIEKYELYLKPQAAILLSYTINSFT